MQQQINCILGPDSACDEIGLKAKRIGPLVLSNHCPRPMCDECTKKAVRMVSFNSFNSFNISDLHLCSGCSQNAE